MRGRVLAALLAAAALAGCASQAPSPPSTGRLPTVAQPPSPGPRPAPIEPAPPAAATPAAPGSPFDALGGWDQEDHAAALDAVLAGCRVARDADLAEVCRRAAALGHLEEPRARAFLETHFRPQPVPETGLLTAYFTPVYEARSRRGGEFTAPVRPRPADLPRPVAGAATPLYPDRAEIERRPAHGALAWMRPEDLFFLQIQGSGVLEDPDGGRRRAVFDGSNGAPFLGLAAPMRQQGLLVDQDTSAERIRAWLAANRGPRAEAVMRLNRRYVFFRLEPDDGGEPAGAAGLRLTPGRALAVDPAAHAMGEVLWLDAASPVLSGAFPAYRRLALALDTGGAIHGPARVDLYLGRGPDAGLEAGRVRHVLRLYRLVPVLPPGA